MRSSILSPIRMSKLLTSRNTPNFFIIPFAKISFPKENRNGEFDSTSYKQASMTQCFSVLNGQKSNTSKTRENSPFSIFGNFFFYCTNFFSALTRTLEFILLILEFILLILELELLRSLLPPFILLLLLLLLILLLL
jgi:hypothetical protein